MRKILLTLLLCTFMGKFYAQEVVKLWNDGVPTSNEISGEEILMENGRVSNISDPDITIYRPDSTTDKHTAIIICPGGGYTRLAIDHEGYQFAEWLKDNGYTAIVLKYRLPNTHKEVPLDDLQQAMRYVRTKSKEWGVEKMGVAGFSAGGHLASSASTHFDNQVNRPDFSILFDPVISMGEYTHQGSKNNLLGNEPQNEDVARYSNNLRITADTPPAVLFLSDDDKSVPPVNSIEYYKALKKHNVQAAMYIFPNGGHGWGMNKSFKYHNEMKSLLLTWLEDNI